MTKAALAVAGALALSACASVTEGTVDASRSILLTSAPSGAAVSQSERRVCTTPCTVRQGQLRYGRPFEFTFPSGTVVAVDPTMEANGMTLGNIIAGGVGGVVVDALTGRLMMNSRHVHVVETVD